jgi:hypothetical protein
MFSKKIMFAVIGAGAGALLIGSMLFPALLGLIGSNVPWINIGENIEIPDGVPNPFEPPIVTGAVIYDLAVVYDDGSRKVYTSTVQFPELNLNSITHLGKEVSAFEIQATAKLNVPKNIAGLRDTMYSESTVNTYLGSNLIDSQPFNSFHSISAVKDGVILYKATIPASKVKISSGAYELKLKSVDQIRFMVNDAAKVQTIGSDNTITFDQNGDELKALQVTTYTPAVAVNLSNDPIYYYYSCGTVQEPAKQCPQITSNKWYITVTATGFKANAPATFTYAEHSYFKSAQQMPIYPTTPKVINTDSQGSATDKYNVYSGYSNPECEYYGATVSITDGLNSVGPLQIGCNYRYG